MPVLKMPFLRYALPALFLAGCVTHNEYTDNYNVTPEVGAYMVVMGKNYDPAALGPYAATLPPIYEKYGGRYVAFSTGTSWTGTGTC